MRRFKQVFVIDLLFIVLSSALFLSPKEAHSATLYVGAEEAYQTIQAGIDAAVDGDTVIVRDGTYSGEGNRDISFNGKAITVKSENGPARCIIDGKGKRSGSKGFKFSSGEESGSILSGFMIQGMHFGINCFNSSSPTIMNCTIRKNGIGIYCSDNASPAINNCTIYGNGGGVSSRDSSPTISNCTIFDNIYGIDDIDSYSTISNCAIFDNGNGIVLINSSSTIINCIILGSTWGGVAFADFSFPIVTNCTILNNHAWGIRGDSTSRPVITNSIVRGGYEGAMVLSEAIVTYSCIEGGYEGEGNIDSDPLFFNAASRVVHLMPNSPCIDSGNPDASGLPSTDKDGNPRVVGDRVDMGAFEYCPTCLPTIALGVVDGEATEADLKPGKLAVYRVNGDMSARVRVPYRVKGTAKGGLDYEMLTGKVAIRPGADRIFILITPIDDSLVEGGETVQIKLRPTYWDRDYYKLSEPSVAEVAILDNDKL